ncbi:hypothetical protein [Mucilaginibacter terrae]|nr:hypothetical protein [Mucilaginibacter terrae]
MKPIFSRNDDVDKIAFLNWRIEEDNILNMLNIADGFLTAAVQLAEYSLIDNTHKQADITIFAILTNANHGIELYLKAITWTLNKIIGSESRIEGSHDIEQIYKTVRAKIKKYGGQLSLKEFNNQTAGLVSYIDELYAKIKTGNNDNMDFSRYPINTKYAPHIYVSQVGNVEVDLENFVSRFKEIYEALENISSFLYHQELKQDW